MRIFFVDPMSYNNLEEYDFSLISNLDSSFETYFFGSNKFKSTSKLFKKYLIFSYSNYSNDFIKAALYFLSLIRLLFFYFYFRPDIIHIQWFKIPKLDYVFLKVYKLINPSVKIIFTAHNILPHNSGNKYLKIFIKIYQFADCIIVHTNNSKDKLNKNLHIPILKIHVINHGLLKVIDNQNIEIEFDFFKEVKAKNKKILLCIGAISKYKGVDILFEAWRKVVIKEKLANWILVIAGKGNVDFIHPDPSIIVVNRFLSDEEFSFFMMNSDVVAFPYKDISQSGVLLTALNYKKPIFVTNVGGLTDPFKYGNVGWIAEKPDVDSLVQQLRRITANEQDVNIIANDNELWTRIHEEYDWKRIAKLTSDLYKQLIAN